MAEPAPLAPMPTRRLSAVGTVVLGLFVVLTGIAQLGHIKLGGFSYLGFPAAWRLDVDGASAGEFSLAGAAMDIGFVAAGCTLVCLVDQALRRWQFSLRALCLGTAAIALLMGVLFTAATHNAAWLREHRIYPGMVHGGIWLPRDR